MITDILTSFSIMHSVPRMPLTFLYPRSLVSCPNALRQLPIKTNSRVRSSRNPLRKSTQQYAYATNSVPSQLRSRPNYKLAAFCCLSAVAATYAVTGPQAKRFDAPPNPDRIASTAGVRVEITGKDHRDDVERIETGTSTVPYFPRKIWLPRGSSSNESVSPALPAGFGAAQEEEEYQLLGLGIRKVSLFRIQVYVVGLYVAKGDVGTLQEEVVKASAGEGKSTLVQGEKEELRKTLLDGEGSCKVWAQVLKEGGVRSAVRIVPTRNTNFSHLRDGWIRGIDLRGKGSEYENESFKTAVGQFKEMLGGRGSVGKGRVLLLGRGADGALRAWVEEDKIVDSAADPPSSTSREQMSLLGGVKDERVSRLVWMGYLAGEHIASEEARESVVNGIMEIVERPFGTVETQVV